MHGGLKPEPVPGPEGVWEGKLYQPAVCGTEEASDLSAHMRCIFMSAHF